jgi:hypothetical protein
MDKQPKQIVGNKQVSTSTIYLFIYWLLSRQLK